MAPSVLVIVPTFNERENLPVLIEGLLACDNVRVMVVDDHSPDGTGEVADAAARRNAGRIEVVHRTNRPGLGRSYIEGIARALGGPADVICQMDADLSHDPRHLPDLVAATATADVVIGSRYVAGGRILNWPRRRRLLSRVANAYIRSVTRLQAHDCTSGYRCWRRAALAALPLDRLVSDGYSFLVEMLYVAAHQGCRVAEVPITFVERRVGQSKLSAKVLLESVVTPWRLVATRGRIR
ncbi:MAG: polyprenol monophosphomannose synthase [Betaproteobacteria bacterium]